MTSFNSASTSLRNWSWLPLISGKSRANHVKLPSFMLLSPPPDIGRNAPVIGMGADGKMKELRAGTNGWVCMLDLVGDSMCLDKEWQAWGDAWMTKRTRRSR
jgi:hypothetical protein